MEDFVLGKLSDWLDPEEMESFRKGELTLEFYMDHRDRFTGCTKEN